MELNLSKDIKPITEFRNNSSAFVEQLKKDHSVMVLTQKGKPAVVIQSVDDFERKEEEIKFIKNILLGYKDFLEGRTYDIDEVSSEIDELISKKQ